MAAADVAALSRIDRENLLQQAYAHLSKANNHVATIPDARRRERAHGLVTEIWELIQHQSTQIEQTEAGLRHAHALIESARAFSLEMQNQRDAAIEEIEQIIHAFRRSDTSHYLVDETLTRWLERIGERSRSSAWETVTEDLRAIGWSHDEADLLYRMLTVEILNVSEDDPFDHGFVREDVRVFRRAVRQLVQKIAT